MTESRWRKLEHHEGFGYVLVKEHKNTEPLEDRIKEERKTVQRHEVTKAMDDMHQRAVALLRLNLRIREILSTANEQEMRVMVLIAEKLMGEGRREHGAMDLDSDPRDLVAEAKDELADSITYLAMELVRMER